MNDNNIIQLGATKKDPTALGVPTVHPFTEIVRDMSSPTGFGTQQHIGITLYEYFAAHAPEPPEYWLMENYPIEGAKSFDLEALAAWRWDYAGAMLAEWHKRTQGGVIDTDGSK